MGTYTLAERNREKNTKIFVDGKSLRQISDESGKSIDTIRGRWQRGYRTYEELISPTPHELNISRHARKPGQKQQYRMVEAGHRFMETLLQSNITITDISRRTGITRGAIYSFIYDGVDISSCRLAKICSCVGVSTDYILGIRDHKEIYAESEVER